MYIRVGVTSDDWHNPPTKNKVPALSVAIDPISCRSTGRLPIYWDCQDLLRCMVSHNKKTDLYLKLYKELYSLSSIHPLYFIVPF